MWHDHGTSVRWRVDAGKWIADDNHWWNSFIDRLDEDARDKQLIVDLHLITEYEVVGI